MNRPQQHAKTAPPAPVIARKAARAADVPAPHKPLIVTEAEAAQMVRLSARTLQRLRLAGEGPRYINLTPSGSRIGYAVADLQAWIAASAAQVRA